MTILESIKMDVTKKKENKTISIVVPLFNKAKYLKRSIDSIYNQTYQYWELIIVDDASCDNYESVLAEYNDTRITLIKKSKNEGVSAARNCGIRKSNGEIIAFLDPDDYWTSNHLKDIIKMNLKFPKAGIYAHAYLIKDSEKENKLPKFRHIPPPTWEGIIEDYFKAALGPPPVWTSATSVNRKVFETVGMFDEEYSYGEDLDMWGRIALRYDICFSWHIGAVYDQSNPDNITKKIWAIKPSRFATRILSDPEYSEYINRYTNLYKYVTARQVSAAKLALKQHGDKHAARKYLMSVRKNNWINKEWNIAMLATYLPLKLLAKYVS